MGWYILAFYLFGCIGVFFAMARHDAMRLHAGEKAVWSHDVNDIRASFVAVVLWPLLLVIIGPCLAISESYGWLIRVFTPKPEPAAPPPPLPPPPSTEPEHVPGDGYRDGGKVCTCGARRG